MSVFVIYYNLSDNKFMMDGGDTTSCRCAGAIGSTMRICYFSCAHYTGRVRIASRSNRMNEATQITKNMRVMHDIYILGLYERCLTMMKWKGENVECRMIHSFTEHADIWKKNEQIIFIMAIDQYHNRN